MDKPADMRLVAPNSNTRIENPTGRSFSIFKDVIAMLALLRERDDRRETTPDERFGNDRKRKEFE